ncbi:recombinase family protein [Maricaulaceae bacterium EIL42A08]|nr:recombinase family protein [Maricaulaceae bacterium EIL42A08]
MTPSDPDRPLAISYLRFSTPEQEKGDSYRRQVQAAEDYAAKHGLELTEDLSFEDRGVSAYRGTNASTGDLKRLRRMVEDGLVPQGTFLLVENLDRLSRAAPRKAFSQLNSLIDAGLRVVTLVDGQVFDEESMDGMEGTTRLLMAVLTMVRANEESRTKSQRLAAANEAKRKAAYAASSPSEIKRLTKLAPPWLTANPETDRAGPEGWIINEEKAEAVRRVFELGRQRKGKEAVAAILNEESLPTLRGGKQWHPSYVQRLWNSPAVIGTHTPHRVEVSEGGRKTRTPEAPIEGYFPAIISPELWADVQAARALAKPRGATAKAPVQNPLAGIGKCGRCGSTVTRVQKGKRSRPSLVCTAAKQGRCEGPYTSVKVEAIETALAQQAQYVVANAPLGEGTEALEAQLEGLKATIEGSEDRAVSLAVEVATAATPAKRQALRDAEATVVDLKSQAAALEAEIVQSATATVKGRMAALERVLWREEGEAPATPEQLSEALQRACEAVVVDWDRKALLLKWRQGGESKIVWGM